MLNVNSPFYLAMNTESPKAGKYMVGASSQLRSTKRKLVNHSTRKHLVQKLADSNVSPTEIAQITGHKNINSINTTQYFPTRNSNKLQLFCVLLPLQKKTLRRLWKLMKFVRQPQKQYIQCRMNANNLPVFNNCQIGTVNVFTQGQSTVGEFRSTKRRRVIIGSDSEESQ